MRRSLPQRGRGRLDLIEALERASTLGESTKRFVQLAARLTNTTVVAATLVSAGEQVFVSTAGASVSVIRGPVLAGCARAIASMQPVVVSDISTDLEMNADARARGLGVAAYASFPLAIQAGVVVGTLFAFDRARRQFSAEDIEVLSVLASAVAAQMAVEAHAGSTVYDDVTGLANRQGFMMVGEHYMKMARRREAAVVLFFVYVERLNVIATSHGAEAADGAVMDTARILWELAREADFVARIAEDKFAVLAVDAEVGTGQLFEDRLMAAVHGLNITPGRTHDLRLFGSHLVILTRREDDDDFEALVEEGLALLRARTGTVARIVSGPQPV